MIGEYLEELKELGITRINLSLDTLDKEKFHRITMRDDFDKVIEAMHKMLKLGFQVKMNAVVMKGINDDEIGNLAQLSLKYPIAVRFIEAMPFDGKSKEQNDNFIDFKSILEEVEKSLPGLKKIQDPVSSTSLNYQVDNALGTVGVIPAFTRNFCSSCNRIRLTSFGELKTCLYESGGISIRDYIRENPKDEDGLWKLIAHSIKGKYKDGFAAEADNKKGGFKESMSAIGG
jgi:cyclic pyranopterin phosphate synthase